MNNPMPDNGARTEDATADALQHLRIISEIRSTIQEVRDLPTLPTIAFQVMKVVANKNASITDLVEIIQVDAALTGKILRTANSAYYGVPRKIDSLKMALLVIGMDEISNLVTTASVLKMFPTRPGAGTFDVSKFWYHNAAIAELTVGLYDALSLPRPGAAYVSGILHDIGRIILYQYFNHHHLHIEQLIEAEKLHPHQAEMRLLGIDHGHIGAWLVQRWNLPEDIISAIAQHHIRPADTPPYSLQVVIDRANELFYQMDGGTPDTVTNFLRDSKSWQEWMDARTGTIPTMVQDLFGRMERASRLLEVLK